MWNNDDISGLIAIAVVFFGGIFLMIFVLNIDKETKIKQKEAETHNIEMDKKRGVTRIMKSLEKDQ